MEPHEEIYRGLKKSGYKGWGGSSFEDRMNGWEAQLDKLFALTELEGNRMLEMGSGAGDVSLKAAQRGLNVTGIEISPTAVEWAMQKANDMKADAEFICGSVVDKTLLQGDKFDLIIDGNCLHCLFNDDRTAFFDNLERLIDTKGYAFISTAVILNEGDRPPTISSIDRCFVTKESIVEELKKRGFTLIEDWSSNGTHEHFYGLFRHIIK